MRKVKRVLLGALMALTAGSASAGTFVGDRTDFRDETIYFAMTTRFYDGDPTNNVCSWDKQDVQIATGDPDWRGDFKGLIDKLDYIKALGFTAVWITPVVQNSSGEDYHGYHAMDFSNVDLRYESRKAWGASEACSPVASAAAPQPDGAAATSRKWVSAAEFLDRNRADVRR